MRENQQTGKGLEKEKADSIFWRHLEMLRLGCTQAFWDQGRGPDALSSVKWFEILTAMLLLPMSSPQRVCVRQAQETCQTQDQLYLLCTVLRFE